MHSCLPACFTRLTARAQEYAAREARIAKAEQDARLEGGIAKKIVHMNMHNNELTPTVNKLYTLATRVLEHEVLKRRLTNLMGDIQIKGLRRCPTCKEGMKVGCSRAMAAVYGCSSLSYGGASLEFEDSEPEPAAPAAHKKTVPATGGPKTGSASVQDLLFDPENMTADDIVMAEQDASSVSPDGKKRKLT